MHQSLGENGSAVASAESIVKEALNAYRTQSAQLVTPIEPDRILATLRRVLGKSVERPLTVRVACNNWADFDGTEFAEFAEFARADVVAAGYRLLVLQHQHSVARALAERRPLSGLVADGAEVRVFPRRLPQMITLGSEAAVLQAPQVPGEPSRPARVPGFLLVRGPELVVFLRCLYGVLWEQATEVESLGRAPAIGLDPVQSQVLAQLHGGAKDETAAREINVSVRTYRRHVASILQSLDVKSRFEAGFKVAQLGLVEIRMRHG